MLRKSPMLPLTKTTGFILAASLGMSSAVHSIAYQNDLGLAYANPADLGLVNRVEVIGGGNEIYLKSKYTGLLGSSYGTGISETSGFLPLGRFAYRLTPKVVVGVDITEPIYSNFRFPVTSFVAPAATNVILYDTDISPRVAFKATDSLTLGLGLNINYLYEAELSFLVPPLGNLHNGGDAWNMGYNLGLSYAINKTTFLGLSFYSGMRQHVQGISTWGPLSSNDNINPMVPGAVSLELTKFLSQTWLVNLTIRDILWSPFQTLSVRNSALGVNLIFPQNYYDSFTYSLLTRYAFNDKIAGLAFVQYLPKSQSTPFRSIGLPPNDANVVGVGAEYTISQGLTALLTYGYVWGSAPIDMQYPFGPALGNVKVTANVVGLRVKYSV